MTTRKDLEEALERFAEHADAWEICAVYLYMRDGKDPAYDAIETLNAEIESAE